MSQPHSPAPTHRPSLPRRLVRHYWRYVVLSALLFVVGIAVGVVLVDLIPLDTLFGQQGFEGAFPNELTVGVLVANNALVVVLLVASSLTLGLGAIIILVYNGVIVGYVGTIVAQNAGLAVLLVGLTPHGIVEIPAFLFASAVALRFSHQVLGAATGRREDVMTSPELREAIVMSVLALALIPVAAYIEANITTQLLESFTSR